MELVNKVFAKVDKFDLLYIMANQSIESSAIEKLITIINDYERLNKSDVGEFYLNTSGLCFHELNNISEFMVSRKVLLNAFTYAGYNCDFDVLFNLKPFVFKKQVSIKELGSLFDYVMEHSMNFDEFCDGQKKKLIFDDSDDSFRYDFIYEDNNKRYFK
jgi:hypothetical protein